MQNVHAAHQQLDEDLLAAAVAGHLVVSGAKDPRFAYQNWMKNPKGGGLIYQWPGGPGNEALPQGLSLEGLPDDPQARMEHTGFRTWLSAAQKGLRYLENSEDPEARPWHPVLAEMLHAIEAAVNHALNPKKRRPNRRKELERVFGTRPEPFDPEESLSRWREAVGKAVDQLSEGGNFGEQYKSWKQTLPLIEEGDRQELQQRVKAHFFPKSEAGDRSELEISFQVRGKNSFALFDGSRSGTVILAENLRVSKADFLRLVAEEVSHVGYLARVANSSERVGASLRGQGQWGVSAFTEGWSQHDLRVFASTFSVEVPGLEAVIAYQEHFARARAQSILDFIDGKTEKEIEKALEEEWQLSKTARENLLTQVKKSFTKGPTEPGHYAHLMGYAEGTRRVGHLLDGGHSLAGLADWSRGPWTIHSS